MKRRRGFAISLGSGLWLGCLASSGCFTGSLLQSGHEAIPAPAARIAPAGLADATAGSVGSDTLAAAAPDVTPAGLRPAPVPQDLPPIPISRE
jgi:hypothetical protein